MPIATQYTPTEAAAVARQHVVTIRLRLEAGQLHGYQRTRGGRWLIDEACLSAYLRGEKCEHQAARRGNVTSIRRAG